jgi:hypothetical protein
LNLSRDAHPPCRRQRLISQFSQYSMFSQSSYTALKTFFGT